MVAKEVAAFAPGARAVPGGVEFTGDFALVRHANVWLRAASRVLVRVGEVRARGFDELRRGVAKLAWDRFAAGGVTVEVTVSVKKSRLYHSGAVAERVAAGVVDRVGAGAAPLGVHVRGEHDVFTLSVDSSGELLHRRGYRVEHAGAPLRETLAAGILALAGWDGSTPLVDPTCGSGTFVIEAALLALGRPPNAGRAFACDGWPGMVVGPLKSLRSARAFGGGPLPASRGSVPPLAGSDIDPQAIAVARANAERAGVVEHTRFTVADVTNVRLSGEKGLIVANPPYGERLAADRRVYTALGRAARATGWRLAVVTSDPALAAAAGMQRAVSKLTNGGTRVALYLSTP